MIFNELQAFIKAIEKNKKEIISAFLAQDDFDFNQTDTKKRSPLYIAAMLGKTKLVKKLLEKGVNVNQANKKGDTALHAAVRNGNMEVVLALLEYGAQAEHANLKGDTPLLVAAEEGDLEIVITLLNKGVSVHQANINHETPLYVAAQEGHCDVVKELLNRGAEIDVGHCLHRTPLYIASWNGYYDIVKELLDREADIDQIDDDGVTPLYRAAQMGHLPVVRILLDRGAAINQRDAYGCTPLHIAAENGHLTTVQELLDRGADIEQNDDNEFRPLHKAVERGHLSVVKELLDREAAMVQDPDINRIKSLYIAAKKGHLPIVQELIDRGVAINQSAYYGNTPLYAAAEMGHLLVVKKLLDTGANVNQADNNGFTPLHIAVCRGHLNIIQELLAKGANPLLTNKNGRNAFDVALDNAEVVFPEPILTILNAYPKTKLFASELIEIQNKIEKHERERASHGINIDDDREVARAHEHFTKVIEPYFKEKFESYGKTDEERILEIESKIRELILDNITEHYSPSEEIQDFIINNRAQLIRGEESALRASVNVFKEYFAAPYSAWRGYNSHSPSVGRFVNLLTEHADDARQLTFSTPVASMVIPSRTNFEASRLIRKRVAYYYLAVMDDEYPENRMNRIVNFITKLSEMRNGHGFDQPMCFPGSITAISQMGKEHPVADLSPTETNCMRKYFKQHGVQLFKKELAKCKDDEAREALFHSLTALMTDNAKDFLSKPEDNFYTPAHLELRKKFSQTLCDKPETLLRTFEIDFKKEVDYGNEIYFEQFQKDPAHWILKALHRVHREYGDCVASQDMLAQASQLFSGREENGVYLFLFKTVLTMNTSMSVKQLSDIKIFLSERARVIFEKKINKTEFERIFNHVASIMGIEASVMSSLEEPFQHLKDLGFTKACNPYLERQIAIENQLMRCQPGRMRSMLEKQRDRLNDKSTFYIEELEKDPTLTEEEFQVMVEARFDKKRKEREENGKDEMVDENQPNHENPQPAKRARMG